VLEQSPTLPTLRDDLQLLPGSPAEDGAPNWMVFDPLRNCYFRIGVEAFELLRSWHSGAEVESFLQQANEAGVEVESEEFMGLVQFLQSNQLLKVEGKEAISALEAQLNRQNQHWFKWLIHHYLFIKVPLWRPDHFLGRTLPWVEPLFSPRLLLLIRLLGLLGILLVVRQWEQFSATFLHFFSWQGLALYGVTLVILKSAHELGHAYSARRHGCRVSSIGVAFLVLFPMLYTDTTDAWRLRSKHDRLSIVLAGIKTEIHIALLATFLWSFLPDGALRSAAFFIATTSWITSLMVNISPFMRFDGYFAFADWLGAENLQPRAFALGRWRLREWLFGLGEAPPEQLSPERAHTFILYAWGTWIYRLFLFLGIALLVYLFAFKLLGIVLFLVEIIWFIGLPIGKELQVWWERRGALVMNRKSGRTLLLLGLVLVLFFVPWKPTLEVAAVIEDGGLSKLFVAESAQVKSIHVAQGDEVEQGTLLLQLSSPDLEHQLQLTQRRIEQLELQHQRRAGAVDLRQEDSIILQQLTELKARLEGLQQRSSRLTLRATVSGTITVMDSLHVDQWVNQSTPVVTIRSEQGAQFVAFIPEADVTRITTGAIGVWVGDDGARTSSPVEITQVDATALPYLPYPELASDYGGPIAARAVDDGVLRPEQAIYRVSLHPVNPVDTPKQRRTGVIQLEGKVRSLAETLFLHIGAVLVRESGF
jgi:putative peptide zinc metalloprotease protein